MTKDTIIEEVKLFLKEQSDKDLYSTPLDMQNRQKAQAYDGMESLVHRLVDKTVKLEAEITALNNKGAAIGSYKGLQISIDSATEYAWFMTSAEFLASNRMLSEAMDFLELFLSNNVSYEDLVSDMEELLEECINNKETK